ncbi:hypothetical protein TNCT1_66060 [Streptomyces sp. 1-11]|nr:hypothetical protein TNCT1_66060 [Streptomyces sp. 1-11]
MSLGLRTAAWLGTGCVSWGPAAHPPDRGGGRRGAAAPARVRPQGGQGRGVGTAAAGDRAGAWGRLQRGTGPGRGDGCRGDLQVRRPWIGASPVDDTALDILRPRVDPAEGNVNHLHALLEWAVTATLARENQPVLTVMSTRSTSVAINRWQVTDVTCQKSTGHTVVLLPEQGGSIL